VSIDVSAAKARRADAERRLQRFQAAIAAGADPAAVIEPMNQAQAERAAAQAEIDAVPKWGVALDVAEVYAMIDSLGDVGATLADAKPAALNRLYKELNVSAVYQPEERAVDVTARPHVDSACVRGGLEPFPHLGHAADLQLWLSSPFRYLGVDHRVNAPDVGAQQDIGTGLAGGSG
jgi:hypothetical protein